MKFIQRANMPAVVTMPAPEVWRFSDCPEDQRFWCDIYEFGRENADVRQVAQAFRNGQWEDPGIFPDRCSNLLGKKFFEAFPQFPERPFLSLPLAKRSKACAALTKIRTRMALRIHHPGANYSNSGKTWSIELHENTPRQFAIETIISKLRDPRGGQFPLDRLRHLGVLRLYNFFENAKKVLVFLRDQRIPAPGKDETAVSKAKKSARQLTEDVLLRIL